MLRRRSLLTPLVLLLTASVFAQSPSRRLTWDQLAHRVTPNHVMRISLTDGTRIEGNPQRITPDGIDLRVDRGANPLARPRGSEWITRESVLRVEVASPGHSARAIGAIAAVGAGLAIWGVSSIGPDSPSQHRHVLRNTTIAAVMVGGGIAALFAGRPFDRRFESFTIRPADGANAP